MPVFTLRLTDEHSYHTRQFNVGENFEEIFLVELSEEGKINKGNLLAAEEACNTIFSLCQIQKRNGLIALCSQQTES